jgi:ribosomal protein L11 methyltransferase
MKEFRNITLAVPEENFELIIAALMDFSILGIREDFDKLIITFDNAVWDENVKKELLEACAFIYPNISILSEDIISSQNWNEEWEKNVPVIDISPKIAITPEWKKHETSAQIPIIINPKMSFGTGQHETTRLIAKLMEEFVRPNQFWIDAGTGTGVLAIIAAKLGARKVYAFDNNSWAVENSIENVNTNNVQNIVSIEEIDVEEISLPQADGICANLYANLIKSNLPKFFDSLSQTHGLLLVSGILVYDSQEVIDEALKVGFQLIKTSQEAEWVAIAFSS